MTPNKCEGVTYYEYYWANKGILLNTTTTDCRSIDYLLIAQGYPNTSTSTYYTAMKFTWTGVEKGRCHLAMATTAFVQESGKGKDG